MKTLSLSEAKMKLSGLVEAVNASDEEIVITKNGSPAAVLISSDEFESFKETLVVRSDAALVDEIRKGLKSLKEKKTGLYTLEGDSPCIEEGKEVVRWCSRPDIPICFSSTWRKVASKPSCGQAFGPKTAVDAREHYNSRLPACLTESMHLLHLEYLIRRCSMANPFVHIELHTKDPDKSKKFYTSMFDWKLEGFPGTDYAIIKVGEGTGGGIMKNPVPGDPDNWLPYVLVDDVAVSTKKAKFLGAAVARDVTEVPDMGWFSVIIDPTGAAFGLWQPKAGM
jgi:prevent-host-death family protein